MREYSPRDNTFESFLDDLNSTLASGMGDFPPPPSAYLTGQIVGLPRSGTTILYQLLAQTMRVGYPSNTMALFWRTPTIGARLHEHLARTGPTVGTESIAGRTIEPLDPHEFGYFWRNALGHSDNSIDADREPIPMHQLQDTLDAVTGVFAKPVVYKNFYALVHIDEMRNHLVRQKYVVITRDPLDVALSLLDVRRRIGVADEANFGLAVQEPGEHVPVHERIANQVLTLSRLQDACEFETDPSSMALSYADLCRNPKDSISCVLEFLDADLTDGWDERLPDILTLARPRDNADASDVRQFDRILARRT